MSYSLSQLDAIGDVDPVAEADVYLAYGRDLQAEEILKEAMRSNPERLAIRTKLLEVYAKRRDTKGFELLATQLYSLTKGEGDDWAKAQELGRQIDPENPLYQPGGAPAAAVAGDGGRVVEPLGASTMPQSVHAVDLGLPRRRRSTRCRPTAAARFRPDLDLDLDLGTMPQRRAPVAAPTRREPKPSCLPTCESISLDLDAPSARLGRRSSSAALRPARADAATSATSRCRRSPPATPPTRRRTIRWRASSSWPRSSARSATWKARATCSKRWWPRPAVR